MKNDESEDGFVLVTRKSRGGKPKKSAAVKHQISSENSEIESSLPKEVVIKQVTRATKEIQSSKFFTSTLKTLDKSLKEIGHTSIDEILCYGIGRYSNCVIARYQLGFLIALKEKFQSKVLIYDPLFNTVEKDIIPELKCELIIDNEEGKRKLTPNICTLLFAPHCPKQLTNNFLWFNWNDNIKNCIILGNSFLKVIFNPTCLIQSAEYILKISPITSEYSLLNTFRFKDIFNDLAFHIFNINKIPEDFYNINILPPTYPENDTGILIKNGNEISKTTSK